VEQTQNTKAKKNVKKTQVKRLERLFDSYTLVIYLGGGATLNPKHNVVSFFLPRP
jgi:hypothetical protein